MRHLNPFQMRRAVRDYKYEVNEGRMTEECSQYLAQLQKDWERHRVKLGVEALRREMDERERERDDVSFNDSGSHQGSSSTSMSSSEMGAAQRSIDSLFDRDQDIIIWEPAKPPEVLGEFLDSRHMLPLLLPSDPRMLSAVPKKPPLWKDSRPGNEQAGSDGRSASRMSRRSADNIPWQTSTRRLRDVGLETLQWVDGIGSVSRWSRPWQIDENEGADEGVAPPPYTSGDPDESDLSITASVPWVTSLTTKPSLHRRGRSGTVISATDTAAPS
ncbi:hypothetical protein OF83DRAFT_527503 [Amylostereum chailletii]|nr:hypothetical protein OF83DRAFT_527503 [Amylostereum chailletii]